jgi:hypothetical protein
MQESRWNSHAGRWPLGVRRLLLKPAPVRAARSGVMKTLGRVGDVARAARAAAPMTFATENGVVATPLFRPMTDWPLSSVLLIASIYSVD